MAAVLDILQSVHLQVPHSQFSCYLDTVTESARRSAGRTLALCACGIQNLPTQRQHEKLNKLDPNMPELPTSSNAQSRCNGLWMTASRMVSCPVELESTATARLAKTRQRKLHLRAFSLLARYLCGCSGELQHCAETTGCTGAVHSGCAPTLRTANSTGSRIAASQQIVCRLACSAAQQHASNRPEPLPMRTAEGRPDVLSQLHLRGVRVYQSSVRAAGNARESGAPLQQMQPCAAEPVASHRPAALTLDSCPVWAALGVEPVPLAGQRRRACLLMQYHRGISSEGRHRLV